jgi:adenosylmethionine-8-amino-7-oxononanoate aminotransferase
VAGAVFRHGYTYSGHSGAAAGALATLDIIEREGLVERVATLEPVLDRSVRRLEGAPLVGEIRTVGLTAAVALQPSILEADATTIDRVVAACLRHGVATRALRGHAVHISPPFVITEDQIDAMVDGIGNALEDVAAAARVPASSATSRRRPAPREFGSASPSTASRSSWRSSRAGSSST